MSKINNVVFTISSFNYLHYALNVRKSFLEHNQNYEFVIFIMDWCSSKDLLERLYLLNNEGIDIRSFLEVENEIKDYPIDQMIARYNILEMNTAIKPFCMEYFFNKGYNKVMYIDPDIQFYSSIKKIDDSLDLYDIVLTPHMMHPCPDDGKGLNCQDIMRVGMNNCGFIAIRNSEQGRKAVQFWSKKLEDRCYIDIPNALFTDQRWSDWFPYIYDNVLILKDYGHNAAYWNLHERVIKKKGGKWYANDDKLIFYHFSGLKKETIDKISKYQNRFCLEDRKDDLRELFVDYIKNVENNGQEYYKTINYHFTNVNNSNFEITDNARRQFGVGARTFVYAKEEVIGSIQKYQGANLDYKYLPTVGLNIIGYIEEMHSIGEVMRSFIENLLVASIPFCIYPVDSGSKKIPEDELKKYRKYYTTSPSYFVNIFFINADQIYSYYERNSGIFEKKYNIVNFWWEFADGLEKFKKSNPAIHAIMCCTNIIKGAVKTAYGDSIKILDFKFPFVPYSGILLNKKDIRNKFGVGEDDFLFFFNFDFNSSIERKNPVAVLDAFAQAFYNVSDVKLIIKTSNKKNYTEDYKNFLDYISKLGISESVVMIDEFLSKNEMQSCINACDVYVSLHHSEGFGMGMCEAMSLGKPVIASRYGGNLDYMNDDNSILIDCGTQKPDIKFEHYSEVSQWGVPDINKAASAMKCLYLDRNRCSVLGEMAKDQINKYFSKEKFKKQIYKILLDTFMPALPKDFTIGRSKENKKFMFKKIKHGNGMRSIYICGKLMFQYKRTVD